MNPIPNATTWGSYTAYGMYSSYLPGMYEAECYLCLRVQILINRMLF